jgi:2-polyprenyl-3-methyl-5-hydroxy-6-metoxy-1,4-benzoquinol methylase
LKAGPELLKLPDDEFYDYMSNARRFREKAYEIPAFEAMKFSDLRGKYVLDYGCGYGYDAITLLYLGCRVDIYDIVPENLDVALRWAKLEGYDKLEKAVLSDTSERYDAIHSYGVLHHIPYAKEVVDRLYQVLKKGGVFLAMLYTEKLIPYEPMTITYNQETAKELFSRFSRFEWRNKWNKGMYVHIRAYKE